MFPFLCGFHVSLPSSGVVFLFMQFESYYEKNSTRMRYQEAASTRDSDPEKLYNLKCDRGKALKSANEIPPSWTSFQVLRRSILARRYNLLLAQAEDCARDHKGWPETGSLAGEPGAGYEAPHSVPQPFPSVGPDGAETENTNSKQDPGRRKRLKERCNRMKMANGEQRELLMKTGTELREVLGEDSVSDDPAPGLKLADGSPSTAEFGAWGEPCRHQQILVALGVPAEEQGGEELKELDFISGLTYEKRSSKERKKEADSQKTSSEGCRRHDFEMGRKHTVH
ncbi:hypothetical protein MJG53_005686 [Ovis ammon polii x Ovis aries]|uniref:Uncharacterized protein n=1 Tax=Ovis ammon polii x Ovis aries TaxID=2918886 RepID=A0ACB9V6C7_9CETA|nr:hypothetical protein MJG53_005686 [Ovis ammon polii x Ovis aries]